jgi:hypothetical protein
MTTRVMDTAPRVRMDFWQRDCREWRLTPRTAWIIAAIPLLFVAAMVATIPYFELFYWLTAEDSVIEVMQFLQVLIAGLLFAINVLLLLRRRNFPVGLLYLLVALGAVFIAGEEIAWGQRIFGWATPQSLQEINVQNETTLHNISWAHTLFIWAALLAGMYGTILPLLKAAVEPKFSATMSWLLIPPLCLVPAFAVPFGYRTIRLLLPLEKWYQRLEFPITKFSEVTEVCLYFGLLTFAWLCLRRLRVFSR